MINRSAAVVLAWRDHGISVIAFAEDARSGEPGHRRNDPKVNLLRQGKDSFPDEQAMRRLLLVGKEGGKAENAKGRGIHVN